MKRQFSIIIMLLVFFSCEKSIKNNNDFELNDTISINNFQCINNYSSSIHICMDSVLNDSRCPTDVFCYWEGNAEVRFSFNVNNDEIKVELNTYRGFVTDTIFNGYKLELIGLWPYPNTEKAIYQTDYIAQILITEN